MSAFSQNTGKRDLAIWSYDEHHAKMLVCRRRKTLSTGYGDCGRYVFHARMGDENPEKLFQTLRIGADLGKIDSCDENPYLLKGSGLKL